MSTKLRMRVLFVIALIVASASATISPVRGDPSPAPGACVPAPPSCDQWLPVGPAMDHSIITVFAGGFPECVSLIGGATDLMDTSLSCVPKPPPQCAAGSGFFVTNCAAVPPSWGYPSTWTRTITDGAGTINNYFSELNMWAPLPATSINEGFSASPTSVNPYTFPAAPVQNSYLAGKVYDTLYKTNPLSGAQLFDGMGTHVTLTNAQLTYLPPPGTVVTIRNSLGQHIMWHDGQALSSWDIAFTYLTLIFAAAPQAAGLAGLVTGVTVTGLNTFQVDLNLAAPPPPALLVALGSLTIIPGHIWSANAAVWGPACVKTGVAATFVFPMGGPPPVGYPAACMTVGAGLPVLDAIAAGMFVGSGPWKCLPVPGLPNPSGVAIGGGCSTGGATPVPVGGGYTLTRFGFGTSPGSFGNSYFRNSGLLAYDIWSGNNGESTHDFVNIGAIAFCFLKPPGTPGCIQWQMGIGNPTGSLGALKVVGFVQVSIAAAFYTSVWVPPFNYIPGIPYACCPFTPTPPFGIVPTGAPGTPANTLVLYEGISTGNAGNPFPLGAKQILLPSSIVGCAAPYPAGGYDC